MFCVPKFYIHIYYYSGPSGGKKKDLSIGSEWAWYTTVFYLGMLVHLRGNEKCGDAMDLAFSVSVTLVRSWFHQNELQSIFFLGLNAEAVISDKWRIVGRPWGQFHGWSVMPI